MKITVDTSYFKNQLDILSNAAPKKSTIPVLECVCFENFEGALRLSVSDQEIYCRALVNTESFQPNTEGGLLNISKLKEIFSTLPKENTTIEFDGDKQEAQIKCGKIKLKMPFLPNDEFLDFESIYPKSTDVLFSIQSSDIHNILRSVAFAVSNDEYRPAMTGICVQIENDRLICVGTDSFRLAKVKLDIGDSETFPDDLSEILIRSPFLQFLGKINSDFDISRGRQQREMVLRASNDNYDIVGRVVNEKFPPWRSVVPSDFITSFSFNKNEAIRALRIAQLGMDATSKQIKLTLKKEEPNSDTGTLCFNGTNDDSKMFSETDIAVTECTGDEQEIAYGFNSIYLNDVLNSLPGDELTLKMNKPQKPIMFFSGDSHLALIMPIKLNI